MKRLIYIICSIIFLSSCNNANRFEISGTILNGEDKKLVFSELLVSGTQEIETIKLNKKGEFKFKSNTGIPKFYQLSVSKNNFITLLIEPGEKININGDAKDMSKVGISGSEGSLLAQNINNQLAETKYKLDSIVSYIESIEGTESFDMEINSLNNQYANIVNAQRDSSIAFIITNLNSIASIIPLYQKYDEENYVLYKNRDLQYIKIVSESLNKKYPDSPHVKALIADKENLLNRYNKLKVSAELEKLTQNQNLLRIPEIYLPNQSGDSISINSVNAKYILLNFWASWSQESIKKNVELLDIYKKYHTKGFEIYQVSLDTKKESWVKVVNFDQLPWINVIDQDGRSSYYARIYNIQNLPTSYLINPDGEIVIANPTKEQLVSTFDYALN